jgi:hypothetical protein
MAGLSLEQWMDRKLQHAAEVCERLTLRIVPASKQAIIAKQAAAQKKAPKEVSESRGLLRVTVVEAENLPKLDLMRASGMKSLHLLLYYSSVLAKLNNASFMWGI